MTKPAILVGVCLNNDPMIDISMNELVGLVEADDINCICQVIQNLDKINPTTYVNSGKVKEIKDLANKLEVDLIIFNDELSHSQISNLEAILEKTVIDRTMLILDIFSSRAKTKEAVMQVELARLNYLLPRLVGMTKSLSHQQGGSGFRGKGETQLELNRRRIEKKISRLRHNLKEVEQNRVTTRNKRKQSGLPLIALVGYTNAGKSSLMNALLTLANNTKLVDAKNILFASLQTSVRNVKINDLIPFLLVDTVGFVDKLAHDLIRAFKSTLEETKEADIILHVFDISNPNYKEQITVVDNILKDLEINQNKIIYVANKYDLIDNNDLLLPNPSVKISAKNNDIKSLIKILKTKLDELLKVYELKIEYDEIHLYHKIKPRYNILKEFYQEDYLIIKLLASELDYETFINQLKKI